eukprot:scaffold2901_cov99-Isochrysis_galbana.AAC.4
MRAWKGASWAGLQPRRCSCSRIRRATWGERGVWVGAEGDIKMGGGRTLARGWCEQGCGTGEGSGRRAPGSVRKGPAPAARRRASAQGEREEDLFCLRAWAGLLGGGKRSKAVSVRTSAPKLGVRSQAVIMVPTNAPSAAMPRACISAHRRSARVAPASVRVSTRGRISVANVTRSRVRLSAGTALASLDTGGGGARW